MNPAEATTTTTTTTTTTKPKIAGYNDQLPIAPLPDELKDADESTKQRYFREAKRVAIEKCRENRCGNDEVTAEMHLGPEIKEDGEDAEGWKRPPLWECTAQEFAYDFFKFHEQRGEFDYEFMWECVRDLLFLLKRVSSSVFVWFVHSSLVASNVAGHPRVFILLSFARTDHSRNVLFFLNLFRATLLLLARIFLYTTRATVNWTGSSRGRENRSIC